MHFLFSRNNKYRSKFENLNAVRKYLDVKLNFHIDDPYAKQKRKAFISRDLHHGEKFSKKVMDDHMAFMRGEEMTLPSLKNPGSSVNVCSECHFFRFSLSFFVDDGDHCIFVTASTMPLFIFNLNTSTLHFTTWYRGSSKRDLIAILAHIFWKNVSYKTLFSPPRSSERRALVVGDPRPTHFIRQSLAYVEWALDEHILPFLDAGGEIWIVRDHCFVDPASIFPQLHRGRIVYTNEAGACLQFGFGTRHMRRIYRVDLESTSMDFATRMLQQYESPQQQDQAQFRCLISLDLEKGRFLNQEECLPKIVDFLAQKAKQKGRKLTLVWDGWTLKPFNISDEKDNKIIAKAISLINNFNIDNKIENMFIFNKTFDEKMKSARSCNLAITTHGTAALLPCRLLKIPTVTYHVSAAMGYTEEVDPDASFPVSQEFIQEELAEEGTPVNRRRFSVDPEGIFQAIARSSAFER